MRYSPKEFSALIGHPYITLRKWDKSGKLKAHRSATNRRYYTHDQLLAFRGEQNRYKVTVELSETLYRQIESLSNQKNKSKSRLVKDLLEDHLALKKDRSYKEFVEDASALIPDFKRQQTILSETMGKLDDFLAQCQATFDHVSAMKSGESYYFKKIHETLSSQNETFSELLGHTQPDPTTSESVELRPVKNVAKKGFKSLF